MKRPDVLITPHEQEHLLIHVAAGLARDRRARGLRLNHPEATAIIAAYVLEGARDGRGVAELMEAGRTVLMREDVMEGVPEIENAFSSAVLGDVATVGTILLAGRNLTGDSYAAEGLAVLPLAGPGVLVTALAPDTVRLRDLLARGRAAATQA